jgi:predicted metal-binding membrane protein
MTVEVVPSRPTEALLRRDRLVILGGLVLLVCLAWTYIVHLATTMSAHDAMAMPRLAGWSLGETGWLAVMWVVMMIAMMLPSVAPAILLFAGLTRRRSGVAGAMPAAAFTLGYLLAWAAFGVLAALAQSVLRSMALLSPAMQSVSPVLGGGLLIAAGIYQWLPFKARYLGRCRSPVSEFSSDWREGTRGALVMGLHHGLVCVQCCWLLMLLLFVAGVMNLVWVAAIAGLVLVEKLVTGGTVVGMLVGAVLAAWGVWVVVGS